MPRRKSKAGRPSLGERARSKHVLVRLTPAEYAAIALVVARENLEIESDPTATDEDRKPATVSSWIRDHALEPLGLGAVAPELALTIGPRKVGAR